MMESHVFGPVTHDYRVKCKRCGYEQYSAAPNPLIPCLSDDEVAGRNGFIDEEIKFVMRRLQLHRSKLELRWKEMEQNAESKL